MYQNTVTQCVLIVTLEQSVDATLVLREKY